jgi:hypothetical protein
VCEIADSQQKPWRRGAHVLVTADTLLIPFPHETDCQAEPVWRYEKECNITNACISNILTDSAVGVSGYRPRENMPTVWNPPCHSGIILFSKTNTDVLNPASNIWKETDYFVC